MKEEIILKVKAYTITFCRWLALGMVVGVVCGVLGAAFARLVSFVTELRSQNAWLIYLLPFGGLISVGVYKLFKATGLGTNQVLEGARSEKTVPFLLAPAIFIGSVITHLFGGSAGREGAALQLGGSTAALIVKLFRLNEASRRILTMCGMGAVFSAVFGTPLGACVFALEAVSVGSICLAAIFPVFISGISAYLTAIALGVEPERFALNTVPQLEAGSLLKVLVIAIAGAAVSIIFCQTLRYTEKTFKKLFKNDLLRIFAGGAIITLLTVILNTTAYNGAGIDIINRIFTQSEVRYEAFVLKIIFTAVTVAAGFKGGEIIPTLFIGATLGGSLSLLLGLDAAFGAAVGMTALFCGVTNCPLAAIFLSLEMFGAEGLIFFALSAASSFLLSGNISLYSGQRLAFSKLDLT